MRFLIGSLFLLTLSGCVTRHAVSPQLPVSHAGQLIERGFSYYENHDYSGALKAYQEALSVTAESTDPMLRADIYYRIGDILHRQQRYEQSLVAFRQGLALVKQTRSGQEAILHNSIGIVYQTLGQTNQAREHYTLELAIHRKSGDRSGEVRALVDIGSTYLTQGRYTKALKYYNNAQKLSGTITPRSQRYTGAIFTHIGSLYAELGQYDKALSYHRKALKTYKEEHDHPGIATTWHNIGYANAEQNHYSIAIPAFRKAASLRGKLQDQFGRAESLNSLGFTLAEDGKVSEALKILNEALLILQELHAPKQLAATLDSIGTVYKKLGDYPKALAHYNQGVVLWRQLDDRDGERTTLGNIGSVLELQDKAGPAIIFYKLSINITQEIRGELTVLPKQEQRAYVARIEENYRRLANLLIDQGRLAEAEQVLTMLKEEEYFEFIRRRSDQARVVSTSVSYTSDERSWIERYREINKDLILLGQKYEEFKERQERSPSTGAQKRLIQIESDMRVAREDFRGYIKDLEAAFLAQGPQRAMEFGQKELKSLKQVQAELKSLGAGTVLIHTFLTDKRLRLLLTTPSQQLHRESAVEWKQLNHLITSFRKSLQNPHSDPRPQAQKLYRYLIAPLEEDLRQAGARRLLFSLDDTLRYLPIAALHDGRQYLGERYALIVYTAASRRHLATRPRTKWRVAGLGVGEVTSGEFTALPAVQQELDWIVREEGVDDPQGILPGVVHINSEFTPSKFSSDLRAGYPVVHIASHFKFRPGNEEDSFLLLGDGRKLTLADIQDGDYPLTGVDLLTLSACDTAYGGRNAHGREIESFAVLAQNLGARAVLATLWPVADMSTAEFMAAFYQHRQQGMSKADALQQTQRMFLRGARPSLTLNKRDAAGRGAVVVGSDVKQGDSAQLRSYAHPYYWAPFILMGNFL